MVISFSCSATTKLASIFVLLLTVNHVHGKYPNEFISIDCGWKNSSVYVYNAVQPPYSSDDGFVDGGLTHEILPEFMAHVDNTQQKTLRSFPNGSQNCYTLPSSNGSKYLLRDFFTYGNYDGLNKTRDRSPFLFGLHIGVNFWQVVDLTDWDPSRTMWKELLTISPGNSLSVCLINFESGTPFISSLELRQIDDDMYPFVNIYMSYRYIQRYRFGNITDSITRYPTDKYDRFWPSWPYTSYPWISLNTSRNMYDKDGFRVPQAILQNALTLDTSYSSMIIKVHVEANPLDDTRLELLPVFHLAEITSGSLNRTFDIYNVGKLLFQNVDLLPMQVESRWIRFFTNTSYTYFSLKKTASSALPPLINAFEVYSVVTMWNSTTSSDDVNYINEVKKQYNLTTINWNGDPCSPREYTWEGLTCDYSSGDRSLRIVRVNMSTSKLRGEFAKSFFKMESLENLDLSHNHLTGVIPDIILTSIKVLNLSNKNLDGPLPYGILQRVQDGLLELRLEGNPMCANNTNSYCSDKKRNTTPFLHIAVIVSVVLISPLVGMCIVWNIYCKGKSENNEDYAMYGVETSLHIDIRRFTYAELKLLTNNFQSIIGKGGFGTVYHGILENGDEVAVKVLMETSIGESIDFLPEVQ